MTHRPPPGMPARHPAICPRCHAYIQVGDRIAYERGAYVHCVCVIDAEPEGHTD